jgi:hypothetical protein
MVVTPPMRPGAEQAEPVPTPGPWPEEVQPPRPPARPDGAQARAGVTPPQVVFDHSQPMDELLGQAAPNQMYLGNRLLYRDGGAESLDPVSPRYIQALLVHWFTLFVIWLMVAIVTVIVFVIILGSNTLAGLVLVVAWLAIGIVAWWFPVWVSLSEWKFMLDGKGAAGPPAFEHIGWALRHRHTPIDRLSVHRLSLSGRASRDYLYAQDGVFRAYICCFAYGDDLYVGWTLWWRVSAIRWFWTLAVRAYQALTLRGSELHFVHRYDSAKALREAIHGAVRQGLDAASGLVSFQGTGTIGSEIPVEEVGLPRSGAEPSGLPRSSGSMLA